MSDELIVSGSGSYAVATEEMLGNAANLLRAAELTREIAGAIQMVDAKITLAQMESLGIPTGAALAEHDLDCAYADLWAIAERAELMSGVVRCASQSYGVGEAFAEGLSRKVAADAAALLGFLFPKHAVVFALSIITLPILAGIGVGAFLRDRSPAALFASEQFSAALNELISDPTFLRVVRHGIMNVDEFAAGSTGLPPSVISALSTAGLIGLASSAGFVQQVGGVAGILKETPVVLVGKTQPAPVAPARSLEERVERIPRPTPQQPWQIRIEKFTTLGERDSFGVYVSGTVNFDVSDSAQPLDGTSNLSLAAAHESASLAAVAAAMREAGVTSESPVELNGYSQGAAVVARLAESGEYNTVGLFTIGGNIGQIDLPDEVPTIIVEHTDDVVVAAGGLQDNNHALIVERQAFGGRALPEGVAVPAHQLSEYKETARLMDQSDSIEIQNAAELIVQSNRGRTTATVTNYQYERVQP